MGGLTRHDVPTSARESPPEFAADPQHDSAPPPDHEVGHCLLSGAVFLVEMAVNFGISFLEEGEQEMADLVLGAFEEQENEAEDACNDIRQ